MAPTTSNSDFWRGFRDGAPFILVALPFSMLFGVLGTEAGLNLAQIMGFSVVVIAGAAQFTAVQLMQENAPTVIVILTSLAVNLRMAMYSAALTPYLGQAPFWKRAIMGYMLFDQNFAASQIEYEAKPDLTVAQRTAYFFGITCTLVPAWYSGTLIGALVGTGLPEWLALDFALPVTFLAMIGPALRTAAHVAAAFTSALVTLLLAGLPYSLGLLIAAGIAMAVGAQVEQWSQRARS